VKKKDVSSSFLFLRQCRFKETEVGLLEKRKTLQVRKGEKYRTRKEATQTERKLSLYPEPALSGIQIFGEGGEMMRAKSVSTKPLLVR